MNTAPAPARLALVLNALAQQQAISEALARLPGEATLPPSAPSGTAVRQLPSTPAAQGAPAPQAVSKSAVVHVSPAAHATRDALENVLLAALAPASPESTAAVAKPSGAAAPLALALLDPAAAAARSPALLGAQVRQALEQSGVFYEAHQGRWLAGAWALEALRREPQGRTAMDSATLAAAHETEIAAAQAKSDGVRAPLALPAALAPVVEQQLHFLVAGELRWQGEAWPGQALQLSLTPMPDDAAATPAQERVWHTTLRLQLPQLGAVEARLSVQGGAVSVQLSSEQAAQPSFAQALPHLAQAFADAGVTLKSATLRTHD